MFQSFLCVLLCEAHVLSFLFNCSRCREWFLFIHYSSVFASDVWNKMVPSFDGRSSCCRVDAWLAVCSPAGHSAAICSITHSTLTNHQHVSRRFPVHVQFALSTAFFSPAWPQLILAHSSDASTSEDDQRAVSSRYQPCPLSERSADSAASALVDFFHGVDNGHPLQPIPSFRSVLSRLVCSHVC